MNILFICTHNRCRSILAEAITGKLAGNRVNVASAGSHPAQAPHPSTLEYLDKSGYDTTNLTSKSWDKLESFSPDIVVTVCDSAAGESCPIWLGAVPKVHWGLPDPSKITGAGDEVAEAFNRVINAIERRIQSLLGYDLENMTTEEIVNIMKSIGETS